MKHDETIELLRSGTLTRRQMTKLLASVGVVMAASPLLSRKAAAEEVNLTLLEWNGYEYESFHPEYNNKYGGQPDVTFFAETEDAFQKMRAGFKCEERDIRHGAAFDRRPMPANANPLRLDPFQRCIGSIMYNKSSLFENFHGA